MYLDTAIIIKVLVREHDSEWFDTALAGETFETSELALAEVRSALLAKERAGHVTTRERIGATEKFLSMLEDETIHLHSLNRAVIDRAAVMQKACHPRVPLRTFDALHLASCDLHRCESLATTDRPLRDACDQFAIALLPGSTKELPTPN